MKICVLGNSQAACLKAAWDIPANRPANQSLTIFAAFGVSLGNLQLAGNRLVSSRESLTKSLMYTAGKGLVDIPEYDAFLVCGLGLGLNTVDARTSHNVMRALCLDVVRNSLAYSLASKVRSVTDAPIYVMHSPLLDERTAGRVRYNVLPYSTYSPFLVEALDIPGSHMLLQPEHTITLGHYTKLEFSQDASRLALNDGSEGIKHKENDYNHMNARYGAARLKDFFERLP